jgi:hypothetical protein
LYGIKAVATSPAAATIALTFWTESGQCVILQPGYHGFREAHVAELVDAADSKSAIRKGVKVRFLSWAPSRPCKEVLITDLQGFFILGYPHLHAFSRFCSANLANFWLKYG